MGYTVGREAGVGTGISDFPGLHLEAFQQADTDQERAGPLAQAGAGDVCPWNADREHESWARHGCCRGE